MKEDNRQKLLLLQSSLDNIYISKAKGAWIRSRAKWIEKGESNSAYFCRLEKERQERDAIRTLLIDGQECTDPDLISKEIFTVQLYSSSYSYQDADAFFEHVKVWTTIIDECFKNVCETDNSVAEIEKAIKCLAFG